MTTTAEPVAAASPWLTTGQLAALYQKSSDSIWRYLRHGVETPTGRVRLKGRKVGGIWESTAAFMEEFIAACTGACTPVMEPAGVQERKARAEQERARKKLRERRT